MASILKYSLLFAFLVTTLAAAAKTPVLEDFPIRVTILEPGVLVTMDPYVCYWALDCATKGMARVGDRTAMLACPIRACPELKPGTYAARIVNKTKWPMDQPVDEHMRSLITRDIQLLVQTPNGKTKVAEYWLRILD
jgi:hypothetical protein